MSMDHCPYSLLQSLQLMKLSLWQKRSGQSQDPTESAQLLHMTSARALLLTFFSFQVSRGCPQHDRTTFQTSLVCLLEIFLLSEEPHAVSSSA